jgi:hypothetical protein
VAENRIHGRTRRKLDRLTLAREHLFQHSKEQNRDAHGKRISEGHPPDFLLVLVALANLMRLSLRERRTHNRFQRSVAGNPGLTD